MSPDFKIEFLDHVAIRVKDIEASVLWYKKVLGLNAVQKDEWGPFPVFLLAGKSGIALFPLKSDSDSVLRRCTDHIAFNVTKDAYDKAKVYLTNIEIPFVEQDHIFFISIYFEDPDGHKLELTTITCEESDFYKLHG